MEPKGLRIWALLGPRRGDNNQVLALAEALELPFESITLRYNQWRWLQPRLLGSSLRSLTADSRAAIAGENPDLTISTGHRSVPVVQAIRRRSAGRTLSVHLGYPRLSPDRFDLVVPTPEYPVPDHPNVLRIPFALARAVRPTSECSDEAKLDLWPAPRRLLILGGSTLYWKLDKKNVLESLSRILSSAETQGGSVWVVGSPRTSGAVLQAIERALAGWRGFARMFPIDGCPSYRDLLAAADTIFVSADSVAMVSDAILTRKPVGLLPIRATFVGKVYMSLANKVFPGRKVFPRDLRHFWIALEEGDLVGTIDHPRSGSVRDLTAMVAARTRKLLGET